MGCISPSITLSPPGRSPARSTSSSASPNYVSRGCRWSTLSVNTGNYGHWIGSDNFFDFDQGLTFGQRRKRLVFEAPSQVFLPEPHSVRSANVVLNV